MKREILLIIALVLCVVALILSCSSRPFETDEPIYLDNSNSFTECDDQIDLVWQQCGRCEQNLKLCVDKLREAVKRKSK